MVTAAERDGRLVPGKVILEPTSGNTGIGLAMAGACKGYRVKLALPECVTLERRQILLAYGAELVLTPGAERTDGAIRAAMRIAAEDPDRYFMPNQFSSPANWPWPRPGARCTPSWPGRIATPSAPDRGSAAGCCRLAVEIPGSSGGAGDLRV